MKKYSSIIEDKNSELKGLKAVLIKAEKDFYLALKEYTKKLEVFEFTDSLLDLLRSETISLEKNNGGSTLRLMFFLILLIVFAVLFEKTHIPKSILFTGFGVLATGGIALKKVKSKKVSRFYNNIELDEMKKGVMVQELNLAKLKRELSHIEGILIDFYMNIEDVEIACQNCLDSLTLMEQNREEAIIKHFDVMIDDKTATGELVVNSDTGEISKGRSIKPKLPIDLQINPTIKENNKRK